MTELGLAIPNSPFDEIRNVDENGNEYWSARNLQEVVNYETWQNFELNVRKAFDSIAADEDVFAAQYHISAVTKMIEIGNGAQRPSSDFQLTRHGAYRVILECDGRKRSVASAKKYFAAQTVQAVF